MVKLTNVHRHTVTDVLEGGLHTVECDITRLVQGLQNTWSSKTTSTAVGSDCAVKKAREEITYAHLARRVNFVNTFLGYNRLGSIAEILECIPVPSERVDGDIVRNPASICSYRISQFDKRLALSRI